MHSLNLIDGQDGCVVFQNTGKYLWDSEEQHGK